MWSFTLFIIIPSFVAINAQQQTMKLQLLDKNLSGGQCLDGSPAGFYYSPPPSGSSNLWVINLKGGGACGNKKDCMSRANSSLGSSKYWPKTMAAPGSMSDDSRTNPDFYMGHHVFGPYCSGDCWSGLRTQPSTNPDTWGLYFSGHLIFTHITRYIAANFSFLDAQYVLLTGESAGAIGVFGNINWLYDELKQNGTYKDNITIKAAPSSGWFFPGNTTDQLNDPMMPPNDYPHWIANQDGGEGHDDSGNVLYDAYLDPKCVTALGNLSWHCNSVHNLYKYIETPIFVMQNKFDTNQLENQFLLPRNVVNNETIGYVEYFGNDMDRSIITQMIDIKNDKNGLFFPSCFDHGGGLGIGGSGQVTTINNYNSSELVGDWYWERNKLPHF
eukprot:500926_1